MPDCVLELRDSRSFSQVWKTCWKQAPFERHAGELLCLSDDGRRAQAGDPQDTSPERRLEQAPTVG